MASPFTNVNSETDQKEAEQAFQLLKEGRFVEHKTKKYFSLALLQVIAHARGMQAEGSGKSELWELLNNDTLQSDVEIEDDDNETDEAEDYEIETNSDEELAEPEEVTVQRAYEEAKSLTFKPDIQNLPDVDAELIRKFRIKYGYQP